MREGGLLGWLLAGFAAGPLLVPAADPGEALGPAVPDPWREALDLTRSPPCALRRLPGVGDRRSVDIARARWAHRPGTAPLRLVDVPGIGPVTERRVRDSLGAPPGRALWITPGFVGPGFLRPL